MFAGPFLLTMIAVGSAWQVRFRPAVLLRLPPADIARYLASGGASIVFDPGVAEPKARGEAQWQHRSG